MQPRDGRRLRYSGVALAAAIVISLLALLPGRLRPALGDTAGPPAPAPPTTQTCPGNLILPANVLCPIIVIPPAAGTTSIPLAAPSRGPVNGSANPGPTTTSPPPPPPSCARSTPIFASGTGTVQGQALSLTAATSPSSEVAPSIIPDSPVFQSCTTESADAAQRATVAIDALVAGAQVEVARLDIPAGAACAGSGAYMITAATNDTSQPYGISVSGSCGPDPGAALTFSAPIRICVSIPQYILDFETSVGGTDLTLIDASGNALDGSVFDGTQVCANTTSIGRFTVAVVVPG